MGAFRNNFRGCGDTGTCAHAQPGTARTRVRAIDETAEKLVLVNSIDERNCQQHIGSKREMLHAFPHRTRDRSQYAYTGNKYVRVAAHADSLTSK